MGAKVGQALSGYCNIERQVWVHSCTQWLLINFIESEAWRDVKLHRQVVPMDCEAFCAHSVGIYKRADQWMDRHPPSQSCVPSRQQKMLTC